MVVDTFYPKKSLQLESIAKKGLNTWYHGITLPDLQTKHSGLNSGSLGLFFFSCQLGTDNAAGNDVQDNQWHQRTEDL